MKVVKLTFNEMMEIAWEYDERFYVPYMIYHAEELAVMVMLNTKLVKIED